jgi:hypothetical protein
MEHFAQSRYKNLPQASKILRLVLRFPRQNRLFQLVVNFQWCAMRFDLKEAKALIVVLQRLAFLKVPVH